MQSTVQRITKSFTEIGKDF